MSPDTMIEIEELDQNPQAEAIGDQLLKVLNLALEDPNLVEEALSPQEIARIKTGYHAIADLYDSVLQLEEDPGGCTFKQLVDSLHRTLDCVVGSVYRDRAAILKD